MKHFRKTHGLNISLTFLAVFLAMGGLFLMNNGDTLGAGALVDGACASAFNGQYITGIDGIALCDAGTLSRAGELANSGGLDGTFNRTCEGQNLGTSDQCIAYRSLGIEGDIPSGSGFVTSGNYIIMGSSGSVTISGLITIQVISGTRNGTVIPPTLVTGADAATGTEMGNEIKPLMTIQAGATGGVGLQASGGVGYFTISFTVPGGSIGQVLKIYRSEDGNMWAPNIPSSNCTLSTQLKCIFSTDHLSYFSVGSSLNWDNMNYINQNFRNAGPTDEQIVRALYGTGGGKTAYTQNRSGSSQCNVANMTVEYITPGTGTIPSQLSGNTIYILTGGNYIMPYIINFSGCNAIIGSGTVKISANTGLNATLNITGYNNIIIENITQDGGSTSGSMVTDGIKIFSSENISINNAMFSNNGNSAGGVGEGSLPGGGGFGSCGINVDYSSYINISNTSISNDLSYGLNIENSYFNTINNVQIYNNKLYGMYVHGSNDNTFNNIESYNNDSYGIVIDYSDHNTLSNVDSINNNSYGMKILNGDSNILHNLALGNNGGYGLRVTSSTGTTYYGALSIFGNANNTLDTDLTAGTSAYGYLGRTAGTANTGTMFSRNNIINPRNANPTKYLLTRATGYNYLRGQFTGRASTTPVTYSVGGDSHLQTQPVKRNAGAGGLETYGLSGTSTSTGGCDRYPAQYAGSDIIALTGNMILSTTHTTINGQMYTTTGNLTVHITSTGANYILDGSNFTSRTGVFTNPTNIDTGINLTGGDGLKVAILQLGTGNTRATHYGFNVIVDTTAPTVTGATATGASITSGGYYSTTGINLYYHDANFSGATLTQGQIGPIVFTGGVGGTLSLTGDMTYIFAMNDFAGHSTGITFTIDSTFPIFTGVAAGYPSPMTGGAYSTTGVTLSFYDANFSGATINGAPYTNGQTVSIMTEGTYVFIITDKAGNTTGMTFSITTPLIGSVSYYTGTMVYRPLLSTRFTNTQTQLLFQTNKIATMTVTGDFQIPNPVIVTLAANTPIYRVFTLTTGDGPKLIYTRFTGGTAQETSILNSVYLDTAGPTVSNALPIIGSTRSGNDMTFGFSGSDGAGVGMSGYYYYINLSGSTYTITGVTTSIAPIVPYYKFIYSGTYNRYIVGIDLLGNRGASGTTRSFDYAATVDAVPDIFSFNTITDADINTAYMSDVVTITGMTPNVEVPVSIDNGVLYISGIVVGRTGSVKQGSQVKIELISSSDYNQTVTSNFIIGSTIVKFRVKTAIDGVGAGGGSTLSSATKLNIVTVFDTIADLYTDNKSKQVEFIMTFKSMLTDLIDTLENDNSLTSTEERKLAILKYLLELTDTFINDNNIDGDGVYAAPNGRRYIIVHDTNKACYTSPNFLSPNKCFPTLAGMKSYIDINNQARTHTVDTSRTPQVYQAPSGKVYTIIKTTSGKYFSYRFISPKYFNSLAETQNYIKVNNPKGRGR